MNPAHLGTLQAKTHKVYRNALGIPTWADSRLMQLPMRLGGMGAPNLGQRTLVRICTTYLQASLGRNVLAQAAAMYLLTEADGKSEGSALRDRLTDIGIEIHPDVTATLRAAPMEVHGDVAALYAEDELYCIYDGSHSGSDLGCGVVFWSPRRGVMLTVSFGLRAAGSHSTDAEWLAKLAGLILLPGWRGTMHLVTDSTASLMHCLTRGPRPATVLAVLLRVLLEASPLMAFKEIWIPAQHDTEDSGSSRS